jgi:hypothetical protein
MGKRDLVEQGSQPSRLGYHSFRRRAAYSFGLVFAVLFIGTMAFHYIEGYSYVNSFYFVSMLATAQGPAITPTTDLGKIVASIIAFVSVGAVIVALGFLFGPFFGKVLRMEERKIGRDEKEIAEKLRKI